MTKEEIMQAVARGWCHPKNEKKTMDVDLAMAISDEVVQALDKSVLSEDDMFERIWQAIKHWDIDNGKSFGGCTGYAGVTGDDVRLIIQAIAEPTKKKAEEPLKQKEG